ncbi:MAG: DUF3098 domain-containing protein [Bacteroidia bacterium]|nr:MAG: DUF3098 domain-containing protein [Bacteroidia bacterium]
MKKKQGSVLLFDRHKYMWLIIGLVVTALGFLLMIGGGSDDPAVFSEDIFSFRRLTLAPLLVLAGYVIQIYAIMKKSTNTDEAAGGRKSSPGTKPGQK